MIRNSTYMGLHKDASGRIICECPALVDGDLWRRANASLDARPASRRGQRNDLAAGAALLSGLVLCGNPECTAGPDSPMCRSGGYYRCTGRARGTGQRKGCGLMVPLAAADALIDQIMSSFGGPVLRPVFHPAQGHQVELDDVRQELRDLPARGLARAAQRAEEDRLWAEEDRLLELPAKPAWTEYAPVTGEDGTPLSWGAKWARSDRAERRTWLRDAGFRVFLGRPGMCEGGDEDEDDDDGNVMSRWDVYPGERAELAFEWTGDEDPGLGRGLPRAGGDSE
jgi:hypothetical protein